MWEDDPGFAPEAHVHHVDASCADVAALNRLVVELMAARLDPARPLWEVWHLGGTPDGGWAVLVTAHHTLVDGVSGSGLLHALLADGPTVAGRAVAQDCDVVPPIGERLRRVRQGGRTLAVPDIPPSVLNGRLSESRGWDRFDVDLDVLRTVAARGACTVNDVYLAALSAGLRQVLTDEGALDAGTVVRTLVPVSMRRGRGDGRRGNLDAAIFVRLPVHTDSVHAMLAAVAQQTARAKSQGEPLGTEAVVHAADLVPALVLARAARVYERRGQRRVNLVASDVHGPDEPLRLCGRPVRAMVPVLPLALGVRVTSALLSYAGRASLSFTVDAATGFDAEALRGAVERAVAELA